MAAGRDFVVSKGGTALAGVNTKSFDWAGEPIDMTTDDDNGRRKLDSATGQEQIDMSVEGKLVGDTLRALVLGSSSKLLTDITLEFPILTEGNTTNATLSGDFFISGYSESGSHNDAITFSASFQSSGDWVYTAEAV